MASRMLHRSFTVKNSWSSFISRSIASVSEYPIRNKVPISASSSFRLRPLVAACQFTLQPAIGSRCFSVRPATSSLNDSSPNWSNRPPKETILLDGCDFEHWLVVMEKPEGDPTRDDIIDSYIKTLATVVGSEEEARMKIYSVSTRCYYAFGALVSEELSYKIKELPRVQWVLPDSYLDVRNKDYGGEPFINGQAVPYDPKYHAEWIRNHEESLRRNKRNSNRPRNFDRSRNFERRRENMQYQTQAPPVTSPMPNIPAGQQPNSSSLGGQPNNPVGPPPSTSSLNAQPNTFGPNAQPNTFSPNPPPRNFSPNVQPNTSSPNAQPNTFSMNAPSSNFIPNPPPNNFSPNAQPNNYTLNPQSNTFSRTSQPNTFSLNSQPSNFTGARPNTGGFHPVNSGGIMPNSIGGPGMQPNMPGGQPTTGSWSNNPNVGPPNFTGSVPPNATRPMAGNVPGGFPPTNINGPPSNAMGGYPNVTGGAPINTGRLPQNSAGGPQQNNFGGMPPMQADARWSANSAPQAGATTENLQSRD